MKARLLKKIRKQYSIIKYTEVDINASIFLNECKEEFGLPFYVLEDWSWEIDGLPLHQWEYKTLQGAKDKLLSVVRGKYKHLSVRNKVKKEKVWYNKK